MKYRLDIKKENNNNIYFIEYENGKVIELSRDNQYKIVSDNNYIFFILNKNLDKVFDIKNKIFLSKKIDMQILYNNYKDQVRKENKKKILTNN